MLAAGAARVLAERVRARLGRATPVDGWRHASGMVLRDPGSRFILTTFALDVWSDAGDQQPANASEAETRAHLAERLFAFLRGRPETYIRVAPGEFVDRVVPSDQPGFTLDFGPWVEGDGRFHEPYAWRESPPAVPPLPVFEFFARIDRAGRADLWLRVHHTGADGAAAQELLTALEDAWGSSGSVVFPGPDASAQIVRPAGARPGHARTQAFLDFSPLIEWRRTQNAQLPEPMTMAAALIWQMGQHAPFQDLHFGTTVDAPPKDSVPRGVGVVVIRPAEFAARADGLPRFVRAFNAELARARDRTNEGWKTLNAAARIPPKLERALLIHALERQPRAFGTLVISILKDAKIFGAPIADYGQPDGFLAIGGCGLPTAGAARVGCASFQGRENQAARFPGLLSQVLAGSAIGSAAASAR